MEIAQVILLNHSHTKICASASQCLMCSYFSNVDLNECETGQHSCNPRTIGSYTCHCSSGFAVSVNVGNERTYKGKLLQIYVFVKDF